MSGPKTSHYRLTPEQRRALQEQLKKQREEALRQRKMAVLREEISDLRRQLGGDMRRLHSVTQRLEQLGHTGGKKTDDIRKAAETLLQQTANVPEETLEDARDALKKMRNRSESAIKTVEKQKNSAEKEKSQDVNRRIDSAFAVSGEMTPTKLEAALSELEGLTLSDALQKQAETLRKKADSIHSGEFADHFYAVSVLPLLKEARAWDRLWQDRGREYEDLAARYRLLAEELGESAETVEFSETAVDTLRVGIERLEREILSRREQEVIRQCVDEAMEEMGYRVVGTRAAAGSVCMSRLYQFGEGTAVCVTGTDDGQITMELGGIDTEDRLPSEGEMACLVDEMYDFCGRYRELEQRLREKGVETTRLSVLPPKAEYAQILNVTPYELTGELERMHVQEIRNSGKIGKKREMF